MRLPRFLPVCTLAVSGLLVLAAQVPAQATTPGADGVVAYVSSTGEIETVNLLRPGAVPVRLAPGRPAATPRFNPYGKRIAYADPSSGAVLTVPVGGGPSTVVHQPAPGGALGSAPTWSPPGSSGQQLALVRTPQSGPAKGKGDIWVVRTDEGDAADRPRQVTTDGAKHCGISSPDWSPDGTRIAYRRSSPNAAGTCRVADGPLPSRVAVRTLATGATRLLPQYPAARGTAPVGPVRFTADGRSVVVGISEDANGCTSTALAYDLAGRSYRTIARGNQCDFETDLDEVVPTPAGQLAQVTNDFTLDEQGGYSTWCLTLTTTDGPTGARCINGDGQPWEALDVQPLPRRAPTS